MNKRHDKHVLSYLPGACRPVQVLEQVTNKPPVYTLKCRRITFFDNIEGLQTDYLANFKGTKLKNVLKLLQTDGRTDGRTKYKPDRIS